jgi:hypothetical protein
VTSSRQDVSTGYAPLVGDPVAPVLIGQHRSAKFVPQLKEWPQITEAINKAAQDAFTGVKSQEAALKEAHERINAILTVYRAAADLRRFLAPPERQLTQRGKGAKRGSPGGACPAS